jgi:LPXTG-site transpeptidase (sortase) family protein
LPTPDLAPIANIVIPKFDIDAPVVVRGVDANNVMETPDGPKDVAWYDFTNPPGAGSNAVFSAHVDYINYGPAVFWHLKDLEQGDLVQVRLESGTVYTYAVESRQNVPAEPTQEVLASIVGDTPTDVITLITCGGSWDGHEYSERVIVRATRVLDAASASAAGASQ